MQDGNWAKAKCAGKMLQRDLKAVGIPFKDANGLYADFQALWHTFITNSSRIWSSRRGSEDSAIADVALDDRPGNERLHAADGPRPSVALASLPEVPDPNAPDTEAGALQATGMDGSKKVPAMVPRGAERLASGASDSAPECTNNGD